MAIDYWVKFNYSCCYHLYNRSADHESIFIDADDYNFFLSKVEILLSPYCGIYAYCIMPNHFHFIIKVNRKEEIAAQAQTEVTNTADKYLRDQVPLNSLIGDQLRRLFSSYGLRYNHKYNRNGPVFATRSKRVSIGDDYRLRYLIANVHHNPIHHRMSDDFGFWKYSSLKAYNSTQYIRVDRDEILESFGDYESFLVFHQQFKVEKSEAEID